jgi:hypothetical protein
MRRREKPPDMQLPSKELSGEAGAATFTSPSVSDMMLGSRQEFQLNIIASRKRSGISKGIR